MAKAHTFSDNFNDNTRDAVKWKLLGDGESREVNQRLELRPPPNKVEGFISQESESTFDLTNSSVKVEVLQTLIQPKASTYLFAISSAGTVSFLVKDGYIHCRHSASGASVVFARYPYSAVNHRWWQLRETAGTTYWEVSADGQQWNTLLSMGDPVNLTSVTFQLRASTEIALPAPGVAIFDSFNTPASSPTRRVEERRLSARDSREQLAELAAHRPHPEHANNNDEVNYADRPFIGNYSKGLKHDAVGDPDPISYGTLLRALESRDPGDFEQITGTGMKLTNPQAGLAFEVAGPDAQSLTQPPAPRFDSAQTASEMGELYWMALARDVPFINYATEAGTAGSILAQATNSLNTEFPLFGGTTPVTAQNLFRGIYPGEQAGPYVSQFLLRGNVDPRKPDGQGRDAAEGFITFGAQVIDQRQWTVKGFPELGAAADYLTQFSNWLAVQNGRDDRGRDQFDLTQRRFIRNLRDGANFVHFDQVVNAWWNAAFYLLSEPRGNQDMGNAAGTGRPQVDMEFSFNPGNPYDPPGTAGDARRQVGFGTFGPLHLLQVLIEVAGRTARAVWWQKWGVHRRLRPEEYGGRLDSQFNNRRTYPLHTSIITSLSTGGLLAPFFPSRYGSYLLPQAYPEGSPTHPAYGAGHASISGACATILKAFFDESALIEAPVVASADGLSLVPYTGVNATQLTVGGELNKLAGNIALFRNAAGVHWRSDYTESLPLGEAVAIGLLQEMSTTFNEDDAFFQFTKFDGTTCRIYDGIVEQISPT